MKECYKRCPGEFKDSLTGTMPRVISCQKQSCNCSPRSWNVFLHPELPHIQKTTQELQSANGAYDNRIVSHQSKAYIPSISRSGCAKLIARALVRYKAPLPTTGVADSMHVFVSVQPLNGVSIHIGFQLRAFTDTRLQRLSMIAAAQAITP